MSALSPFLDRPWVRDILTGAAATLLATAVIGVLAWSWLGRGSESKPRGILELSALIVPDDRTPEWPWRALVSTSNLGDGDLFGCSLFFQDVDAKGWPLRFLPSIDLPRWPLRAGDVKGSDTPMPYKLSRFKEPRRNLRGFKVYFELWVSCVTPPVTSEPWFFLLDYETRPVPQRIGVSPSRAGIPVAERCPPRHIRRKPCDMPIVDLAHART
jgi:hypothetical protein